MRKQQRMKPGEITKYLCLTEGVGVLSAGNRKSLKHLNGSYVVKLRFRSVLHQCGEWINCSGTRLETGDYFGNLGET